MFVEFYLPFTGTLQVMAEAQFIALPRAGCDDLRARAAEEDSRDTGEP
jgi:hypothetical protein